MAGLDSIVHSYLEAFEARDMEKCLGYFDPDAKIDFQNSEFAGIDAIRTWHQERFDADLRMLRMDDLTVQGDTVSVDAAATSKRLRAWKLNSIDGTITIRFQQDKIVELSFGVRLF